VALFSLLLDYPYFRPFVTRTLISTNMFKIIAFLALLAACLQLHAQDDPKSLQYSIDRNLAKKDYQISLTTFGKEVNLRNGGVININNCKFNSAPTRYCLYIENDTTESYVRIYHSKIKSRLAFRNSKISNLVLDNDSARDINLFNCSLNYINMSCRVNTILFEGGSINGFI